MPVFRAVCAAAPAVAPTHCCPARGLALARRALCALCERHAGALCAHARTARDPRAWASVADLPPAGALTFAGPCLAGAPPGPPF